MLGYANWYSSEITKDILFFVPFMQVLLIGPVVCFYTKSLMVDAYKFSVKDWFHFLPVAVYFVYSLIVFITDKLVLDEYYFYADDRDKDLSTWYQMAGLISMSFYLVLSLRYYANYKKRIFNTVSYAESILLEWMRNFLIAFLSVLLLRVVFFILNPDWGEFGSQFWYYISFSLVFYYISINGYAHSIKATFPARVVDEEVNVFISESVEQKAKEQNTTISTDLAYQKDRLETLIKDNRLYENPRLNLSDVAAAMQTTPKAVSSIVNIGFQMNFNDFINHYRVEAVIEKLKGGEQQHKTFLGIAYECGFNSKATFNRAFKKNTSLSPKEYTNKVS